MKCVLCLLATFLAVASAAADDSVLQPGVVAPVPAPVATSPPPRSSYRVVPGPSVLPGPSNSRSTLTQPSGRVIEWYHAGSSNPTADLPDCMPPCGRGYGPGMYGPVLIDVLLIPDISSRF